jgi:protein-S-isoprenylcysteine O-methyltransferase Ste14
MRDQNQTQSKNLHRNVIHRILAHSYSVYFILFLISISVDILFKFKIPTSLGAEETGFILMVLGSLLIFWAQDTSRDLKKGSMDKNIFYKGPYRYTRTPTHFGLFFLILGFGIMFGAPIVIISTFISFIVSKSIFLYAEEKILSEKYGAPYLEYKKSVRF